MLKHDGAARAAAEHALALEPRDALTLDTVGVVLARVGAHERAADAFRRATDIAPHRADFHYNLGASLRFLGDFAGAEAAFERAVQVEPRFFKAYSVLAELRATPDRARIERLRALLAEIGDDVDGELHLRHALAKELEDLGDYDAAFAELEAGKRRKRAAVRYDFESDRALFERIEAVCGESWLAAAGPGHADDSPIFVVGMPRTGTTLVERIIASHSQVSSVGELPNFGIAVKRAARTTSPKMLDPETVSAAAAAADLAAVGREYVESTRELRDAAPRFVDKMPLNFFYLGFIAAALPNARIVCVRRNPLDTCVASYRRLFGTQFPYYYYAYDLADVGRYYASFDRLIRHWRALLGGRLHEIEYEALVAGPRDEARRLLDHLGLGWEEGCLEFHRNTAPVTTASAVQVREPLHAGYVGRWRRYAGRLAPLIEQLEAAGIRVDAGARTAGAGG